MMNNKYIFIINLLFIFTNIILIVYLIYKTQKNKVIINMTNYNINKGNNSLYNLFKYPQISILIPNIEDFTLNLNISIFNFLNSLINQTLKEVEISFALSGTKNNYYNIMKNYSKYDKRINIFFINVKDVFNNIFYLIRKSKGKFIYIINKPFKISYSRKYF